MRVYFIIFFNDISLNYFYPTKQLTLTGGEVARERGGTRERGERGRERGRRRERGARERGGRERGGRERGEKKHCAV